MEPAKAHSEHSSLREVILEHAFVADLLRHFWRSGIFDVEVLRSEFDAGGYELVVSRGSIIRHVQLKAKRVRGKTRAFPISQRLAHRKAGCIVVVVVNDDLQIDHFRWFGGGPGEPLPLVGEYQAARHTKGDASGVKAERRQHFLVPLSQFTPLPDIASVAEALLGDGEAD